MAKKPVRSPSKKQWTVLVYLAGDNNLSAAGEADVAEMKAVGSTDEVNVVVQLDRAGPRTPTGRYLLQRGTTLAKDLVQPLGETNTGDPAVLEDFLTWGCRTYPAERRLVVLWNHGAGWDDTNPYRAMRSDAPPIVRKGALLRTGAGPAIPARQALSALRRTSGALFPSSTVQAMTLRGIAYDDQARDFLDSAELKRVLTAARRASGSPIDVLGFDACLMSMVEVGYQLRGTAELVVGSEESEPNDGWPYDRILKALAAKPSMTPKELASQIVRSYLASYGAKDDITQSAVEVGALESVASALDALGKELAACVAEPAARLAILQARCASQDYSAPYEYVDLVDLATRLRTALPRGGVTRACEAVEAAVRGAVVESGWKGAGVAGSHGLSVYFPKRRVSVLYPKLDLSKKTSWSGFLSSLLAAPGGAMGAAA